MALRAVPSDRSRAKYSILQAANETERVFIVAAALLNRWIFCRDSLFQVLAKVRGTVAWTCLPYKVADFEGILAEQGNGDYKHDPTTKGAPTGYCRFPFLRRSRIYRHAQILTLSMADQRSLEMGTWCRR